MIGASLEDLDTPALLLDRQACLRNLHRMSEFFQGRRCRLRPHFKNHKCPALARLQLEAGSVVGLTCAKLGEAEILAEHGFENVLIANQVVGQRKMTRLVEVARRIDCTVAVDDPAQVLALSEAACGAGCVIGVLVEVDIGMARCGVSPGQPALELARLVSQSDSLCFEGLQAYEGHLVYLNDRTERSTRVIESMSQAVSTRKLIESDGIEVKVISGGSTSTYTTTAQIDGVDEIQAGTYATMDWRYYELAPEFEIALSVLCRVISSRCGAVVLDVGVKGVGGEFGPPQVKGFADIEVPAFSSEEHIVLRKAPSWSVGQSVQLLSSHACTTCNLHRQMIVHEDGKVVEVWPIEASGRLM